MWAVTGASGFVGSAVVAELRKAGREVVGLSRHAHGRSSRDLGAEPQATQRVVRWDLASLRDAFAGATGLVHCAAVVHRPHGDPAEHRFTVDGTRMLLEAARAVGVGTVVLCSTIKVHGEHPPEVIDERTAVAPEGAYAEAKAEAERLVLEEQTMRTVVLRLCPVFGVGDKGNVRAMVRAIRRRLFFVPGGGDTRKSIVHVSTVAAAIETITRSTARGVFLAADHEAPSVRRLANTIARALGRSPPPSVPLSLLRRAGAALGYAAALAGRTTSFSAAQVEKAATTTVCVPIRLERELGVDCHVDLDAAIREEVAWLRARGDL